MEKCIEIIAYSIKPDKIDEFKSIKDLLIKEARSLDGLVSTTTLKSMEHENIFLDKMEWVSKQHAEAGLKNFRELPSTKEFMALMDGPPVYTSRFEEMS